jgi:hypothetical protein
MADNTSVSLLNAMDSLCYHCDSRTNQPSNNLVGAHYFAEDYILHINRVELDNLAGKYRKLGILEELMVDCVSKHRLLSMGMQPRA